MGSADSVAREREARRVRADQAELAERVAALTPNDGDVEPQKGVHLYRQSFPTEPVYGVYEPAFCVIAQGSKTVLLGEETYRYDPANYLLVSIDLPIVSRVIDASPSQPYLGFRLELDRSLVASAIVESGEVAPRDDASVKGIDVGSLDAGLVSAVLRLVALLESPKEYRALGPLITREIVYRLLMGDQGRRLRQIALVGAQSARIAAAVERLRREFDRPLRIEGLATELGMSVSGFHHHFKAVTAMSPLQFQKQLRLHEARRLMLAEGCDAARAGFKVGYEDASQFTREYKRMFGEPPLRDVERLRAAARVSAEA